MKLKLLLFMGILSLFYNTVIGQNTAPSFQVPPINRIDCPGYVAANIQYQVTDDNTSAANLVVTASAVGAQAVTFSYAQDPTGILRAIDVTPVAPFVQGIVTVTLTLSDVGNPTPNLSTTAVFTINFEDTTPPIISTTLPLSNIDENISSSAGCSFTVPDYTGLISATDYCTNVTITQSPVAGDLLIVTHNEIKTITLYAKDDYGNTASTTFDITLKDVTNPGISAVTDFDVNINALDCDFTIPDYTSLVTTSDICGTVTVTQLPLLGTVLSGHNNTQLITLTADDGNGNTATSTFTITLKDVTVPSISAVTDFDVNINAADCDFTIPDYTSLVTKSDNCGTVTVTQLPLSGTVLSGHNITQLITLTADDGNGNTATSTFTITLKDVTLPIIKPNGVIALNGDFEVKVDNDLGQCGWTPSLLQVPSATATDNCTIPIIVTPGVRSDSPLTLSDEYPVGTTTIIWTVTDDAGNVASATQTVTVNDNEDPVFTSSFPDLTVPNDTGKCTYDTAQLPLPSGIDNCSLAVVDPIKVSPASISVSEGPVHAPRTVTWTITDVNGNTATATQNVTVEDIELPIMRTKNITKYFDANGQITILPEDIDDGSTDNSGTLCFTKVVVPNILYCGNKGDNSVVLTGTDLWGNQHYKEATVTAVDNTNPTFVDPVLPTIELNTNTACTWVGTLVKPKTADNCSVFSVESNAPVSFPIGNTTVTWTVTDSSGLTATATQTVTVNDIEKPIAKASDITIKLSSLVGAGAATITVADVDNGSSDNCGIKTRTISKSTFDCTNVGPNTVVLTVTDNSDNVSTANAIVTVVDDILPVIAPVSAITENTNSGCGANITVVAPSATDNCTNGTAFGTRSDAKLLTAVYPLGRTIITWNFSDASGNAALAVIQTVDVSDDDKPTITTTPIIVDTNSACIWTGTLGLPVTADNCSVVSVTSNRAADFAYPVGDTDVIWTATDAAGNIATATQVVTVNDSELPIAKTNSFSVTLDAAGEAIITAAQVDNGSSDNCGILSTTIDISSFDCSNVGANTVVLTVTDNSGNVSTGTATVTVEDKVGPIVTTKPHTASLDALGNVSILASDVYVSATDACGIKSMSVSPNTFTCSNVGTPVTVTVTVIDNNDNVSTATATVTVEDKVGPMVTTKPHTAYLDASGNVSILASDVYVSATDACVGIKSMSVFPNTFTCSNVGTPVTVTLTVTDKNNNVTTENATVTVQDKVAPVVITKPYTAQLNALGTVTIVPTDVNNGSTDNCAIDSLTLSKDTFTCANVGSNSVALTAKDASGNTSIAFATVIVEDKIAPVVVAKDISLVLDNGSVTIKPEDVLFTDPTDACGVNVLSYRLSKDTFTIADVLAGSVTITVYATDINGNEGSDTATLTFPTPIIATQAITPNGDGINDTWIVENITNHPNSVVRVFNRWGSLVYSAKNYQNDWDGKLNGSDVTVPDGGSYYYQIDLKGTGNVDSEGWLYISRQ
jgi:gliding motility-associated-like protein